jgi:hypothetical protein
MLSMRGSGSHNLPLRQHLHNGWERERERERERESKPEIYHVCSIVGEGKEKGMLSSRSHELTTVFGVWCGCAVKFMGTRLEYVVIMDVSMRALYIKPGHGPYV